MIGMHPIAMSVPSQPFMPDELKDGGVDGHAEGLPPELGAEAEIRLSLVLDVDVALLGYHDGQRPGRQSHAQTRSSSTLGIRSSFLTWTAVFSGSYARPDDFHAASLDGDVRAVLL